jgi:hypothetical protein
MRSNKAVIEALEGRRFLSASTDVGVVVEGDPPYPLGVPPTFTVSVPVQSVPSQNPAPVPGGVVSAVAGVEWSGHLGFWVEPLSPVDHVTVDWGDGTSAALATISTDGELVYANGVHTYAQQGTYTVTTSWFFAANLTTPSVNTTLAAVAAPAVATPSAAPATAVAGSSLQVGWSATLPTESTAPTVVIHWGDGTHSGASATLSSTGQADVADAHVYRKAGVYHPVAVFMEKNKVIRRVRERVVVHKIASAHHPAKHGG